LETNKKLTQHVTAASAVGYLQKQSSPYAKSIIYCLYLWESFFSYTWNGLYYKQLVKCV